MNELVVKIAGLYEKRSQNGTRPFIGQQNGARLVRFADPDKRHETASDCLLDAWEREGEPLPMKLRELTDEELPPAGAA